MEFFTISTRDDLQEINMSGMETQPTLIVMSLKCPRIKEGTGNEEQNADKLTTNNKDRENTDRETELKFDPELRKTQQHQRKVDLNEF